MAPYVWVLIAAAGGTAGIAWYLLWGPADRVPPSARGALRELVDRVAPLDADRALDRLEDEAARAGAHAVRRSVEPGSAVVCCGTTAFAALGGDAGQVQVKATVQGALAKLNPPLPDHRRVLVTFRCNDRLEPGQITVALAPRTRSLTPMPVGLSAEPRSPGGSRPQVWTVSLQSLTDGIPNFEVRPGRVLVIGRENSDLLLPESAARLLAGRQHAEILAESDTRRVSITDNTSTNGTFVNGRQVDRSDLEHGDQLCLGQASWVVSIGGTR